MDETEWLLQADPQVLMAYLADRESDRKLRLFSCACCRGYWGLLRDGCRRAIAAAERYADGLESVGQLWEAREAARLAYDPATEYQSKAAAEVAGDLLQKTREPWGAAWAHVLMRTEPAGNWGTAKAAAAERQGKAEIVAIIHDVFANHFRRVSLDPTWLTPDVVQLAHAAYDERQLPSGELDPQRLLVLADALEDAGCTNADVLSHLRGPGVHVRGCWCVDMLTGRH